jgi:cell shape-determining protein MreC
MLLAAKDRRIKQLEEENRRLQKELKVALGKQYEQL